LNTEEIKDLVIFVNQRNAAFLIRQNNNIAGYVILGKHRAYRYKYNIGSWKKLFA
jgi:hypothetical protein